MTSNQGGDVDYSTVDLLYRDPGGAGRRFNTFSQELRLQGNTFNDRLDWLVGGYYAHEDLKVTDNLKFGDQYGRFATCRIVSPGSLSALYSPGTRTCQSVGALPIGSRPPLFGPASPLVYQAFENLEDLDGLGGDDIYNQNEQELGAVHPQHLPRDSAVRCDRRPALHDESKDFDATFHNDNGVCTANQALLGAFVNPASPAFQTGGLFTVSQALLGLSCVGNSTAELNGVSVDDSRSEGEFTGTGVLSYKPNDDLLFYASYSRGYKAGGFNLDRSAFKAARCVPFSAFPGGAQAWSAISSSTRRPTTPSKSAANTLIMECSSTSRSSGNTSKTSSSTRSTALSSSSRTSTDARTT